MVGVNRKPASASTTATQHDQQEAQTAQAIADIESQTAGDSTVTTAPVLGSSLNLAVSMADPGKNALQIFNLNVKFQNAI